MSAAALPETRTITADPAPAMARETVGWMLTRNRLGVGVQIGALIGAVVVAALAFLTDIWWLGALLLGLLVVSGLLAAFSYVLVLRSVRLSYPVGSAARVAFEDDLLVSVSAVGSQSLSADAFLRVVVRPSTVIVQLRAGQTALLMPRALISDGDLAALQAAVGVR